MAELESLHSANARPPAGLLERAGLAADLGAFLDEAARTPFAWGVHDCLLFTADWIRVRTGIDPAAPWRGTYASEDEAQAILTRYGGLAAFAAARAIEADLVPATPHLGAVGLVRSGTVTTGALFDGLRWVTPSARGLFARRAAPVAVWGLHA